MNEQHPTVKKLFLKQAKIYSGKGQLVQSSLVVKYLFKYFSSYKKKKPLKICEFGGGGGGLLFQIDKEAKFPVALFNAEIVADYQKYQASKKIKFCEDSILLSNFPDKSFDCLIIRDVLHHLIGKNLRKTRENQRRALKELKRLLKPGGVILIEELVNKSALVCQIIYYFSFLNSKIGLKMPSFEISPYTIVAFLTPEKLKQMIENIFGAKSIININFIAENENWQAKLIHFGSGSQKIVLAIKI